MWIDNKITDKDKDISVNGFIIVYNDRLILHARSVNGFFYSTTLFHGTPHF